MSDTKFRLIDVGVSIVWLACVGISVLKGKLWSAALGVLSAVAVMAGWTVGGWYIFNPLTYVPVFAAIRLGRPDFYWARWFYRKNPRKFSRAILKYGMAEDDLEAQRRARDAFTTARSRYEESQREISSYTTLARDRAAIMRARIRYDETKDSQAYEKEVATFTDPAAFAPYTERELDDFAIRIERLAGDFEAFGTAFATLGSTTVDPDEDFYLDSAASFNVYCETFRAAVDAYKITALAAQLTAAQMKAQAARNHATAWIFEQVGDDADENQRKVAGAKAAPLKAMATEEETTAERLEQKAKAAETRAKLLLSKVGAN